MLRRVNSGVKQQSLEPSSRRDSRNAEAVRTEWRCCRELSLAVVAIPEMLRRYTGATKPQQQTASSRRDSRNAEAVGYALWQRRGTG